MAIFIAFKIDITISYSSKDIEIALKLYGDRKIGPATWVLTRLNFAAENNKVNKPTCEFSWATFGNFLKLKLA